MFNFAIGCIVGWLITIIVFVIVLAFCRVAAESDPESDYYKKVG